ncbi:MAG: hypothetical protein ACF8NJ_06850 [Phycisphaerales bacterium JB038]
MTDEQLAGLEARLSKLERQNRRLRRLAAVALLLGGGLLLAAAADDLSGQRIRPSSVDTNSLDARRAKIDKLEAGEIEVGQLSVRSLEVGGLALGELRIGGAGRHTLISREGMRLFDRSGTERLRLVIPEEFDTPILEVLDEDGETRQIALGCWEEEGAGEGFCGLSILDLGGEAVFEVALPMELLTDYLPPHEKQERTKRVIIRR